MERKKKSFSHLLEKLKGFSRDQIELHLQLYEGYIKDLNKIEEQLKAEDPTKASYAYSPFSELKRRYAVAYEGVHLHEMYFTNMGGPQGAKRNDLHAAIDKTWGSVEKWRDDLLNTGKSGPGWVITAYEAPTKELKNIFITEHHIGWMVNHTPIVVMDMWEHAYLYDFKLEKKDYVQKFVDNLDWSVIENRFHEATTHSQGDSPQRNP